MASRRDSLARAVALALAVAFAAPAAAAPAADSPAPPPAEEPLAPPPALEDVLARAEPCPDDWMGRSRSAVGGAFFSVIRRFDRTFGATHEDLEAARDETYLRLGVDSFADQRGRTDFGASVSARVRLPALERRLQRLSLEITGRTDRVGPETPFARDPRERDTPRRREPTPLLGFRRRAFGDAELRQGLYESRSLYVDVGAGAFLRVPPDTYVRAQVQRRWATREQLAAARLGLNGFVASDVGPGGTLRFVVQQVPFHPLLLQWESEATYAQARVARRWGSQATASAQVARSLAVAVGASMDGALWPDRRWEYARLFGRARSQVLRSWLFLELEPQLAFEPRPSGPASRALGLTVRLEALVAPEPPRCK